jgi:hypothetical protein
MAKKFKFEIGEKTQSVWCGDIVTTCEYLGDLGQGRMLFWDVTFRCFRRVFIEMDGKTPILNGWDCASRPSKLL